MRLIKNVEIRNFRSLRAVALDDLAEYNPVVGLNGSGKSNLLRALSMFFTGEVESGVPVNMKRDHHDPGRTFGGRRRISVTVTFDLAAGYEGRTEVAKLFDKHQIGDEIKVERSWAYADPSGALVNEEFRISGGGPVQPVDDEDLVAVGIFVRSVRLRYIPNHVRPADLISVEIQTLRAAMNRRVRRRSAYRTGNVQEALDDLGAVANEMLADVSKRIVEHSPELAQIIPTIPQDFAELAFQLGIQTVTATGLHQPPEMQGSGTQSYLLFHLLDLIDNSSFEGGYGWTKAVVWAIEEPESFLHAGLRTRLADDLVSLSSGARRQIFLTTHETEFQRPADKVWVAEQRGATTSFTSETARDAVVTSSRMRISTYQHPLHLSPDRPLVILEGVHDTTYVAKTAEAMGLKPLWTMICLNDLEETKQGGDDLSPYLKANASVLKSRPLHAPIIVVRDWEDKTGAAKYAAPLSQHATSRCVIPPESLCNPQLDDTFRGIERFLETDLIENVLHGSVRPKSTHTKYPLNIDHKVLAAKKRDLLAAFDARPDPGLFMTGLVEWLNDEVLDAVGAAPTRQMLLPY